MSFTKINHYEKEYADMHHDTALNVTEEIGRASCRERV